MPVWMILFGFKVTSVISNIKRIILICKKIERIVNLAKYLFNSFLIESSPELKIRKFKMYLSIRLFERHRSLANNIWIVFDVIHCSDSIRNIFSLNWDGFWTIGSTLKMKKKNIHLVCIWFQTFQCKRNILHLFHQHPMLHNLHNSCLNNTIYKLHCHFHQRIVPLNPNQMDLVPMLAQVWYQDS